MKKQSKTIIGLTFVIALLFTYSTAWSADLIAPSRSLSGSIDEKATLSVSSEPPGLGVTLDGTVIGETPVIEKEIEPGTHVVRIGDSQTQIYSGPGKYDPVYWPTNPTGPIASYIR